MIGFLFLLLFAAIVVALLAIQTGLRTLRDLVERQPDAWRWEPNTGTSAGATMHRGPVTASTAGRRP